MCKGPTRRYGWLSSAPCACLLHDATRARDNPQSKLKPLTGSRPGHFRPSMRCMMWWGDELLGLFVLPLPIACIAWTLTHEEVLREPRDWCVKRSRASRTLVGRKFFYLFTCEYCFSHYVA